MDHLADHVSVLAARSASGSEYAEKVTSSLHVLSDCLLPEFPLRFHVELQAAVTLTAVVVAGIADPV